MESNEWKEVYAELNEKYERTKKELLKRIQTLHDEVAKYRIELTRKKQKGTPLNTVAEISHTLSFNDLLLTPEKETRKTKGWYEDRGDKRLFFSKKGLCYNAILLKP